MAQDLPRPIYRWRALRNELLLRALTGTSFFTIRVVRGYEKDLNGLLTQARFRKRAQLVDELRSRVDSFDIQISKTVQEQLLCNQSFDRRVLLVQ